MGFEIIIWIILNQIIWIWLLVISYYRWHSCFIDTLIFINFMFQIVYMLISLFIFNSLAIISAIRRYNSLSLIDLMCRPIKISHRLCQPSILAYWFLLRMEVIIHCLRPILDLFQMSANIIRIMKHIHINIFYLVQYIAHPIWFLLSLRIGSFSMMLKGLQRLFALGIILSVKGIAFQAKATALQHNRVSGR